MPFIKPVDFNKLKLPEPKNEEDLKKFAKMLLEDYNRTLAKLESLIEAIQRSK